MTFDATGLYQYSWLLIAIPALSALLLLTFGPLFDRKAHWLGVFASCASCGYALALFYAMLRTGAAERAVDVPVAEWISAGSWTVSFGLQIDQLSILFALLITTVGSIIHIYSVGYMADDPRRRRFFAYLNLFIAAMLLLVLADSYLTLFVGWEGVGLASYLLIGFWQHKPSAAAAAKKAFVMNRIGDLGLTMAMFSMFAWCGSVSFADVFAKVDGIDPGWVTAIGFFLLLAACGKSAQVPLQAWLLDAMEGPTPVSALIHAATMVTAGVYLIVRSNAIYALAPVASVAVVIVALVTIFVGAWIGCSKDDIKKVLAGSTMSQIGYMMLAAGLGALIGPVAYAFAIFHLLTHGCFKANMFLGAGSVMHATDGDVDMRHFGALRKALPVTFLTFACGYLAIIGIPPLAGYFSKDHIVEAAFEYHLGVGLAALIGAGLTAFYMTRLLVMTFFGKARWVEGVHPHESPKIMTIPLILLALASIGAGVALNAWIIDWMAPISAVAGETHAVSWMPTPIGIATLATVALGVLAAIWLFGRCEVPSTPPQTKNPLVIVGRRDVFGDVINDTLVVKPVMALSTAADVVDQSGLDRMWNGLGKGTLALSQLTRKVQTGRVRSYALVTVLGALLVGVLLLIGQLG
ncbi:MAG: NADH-quinone oxidoreductase subunit L [Propionibacteriaceae bacterium]|nr:NADH-quinone oxidoreductase subunit L [Propionibacteriaceae bacterium]